MDLLAVILGLFGKAAGFFLGRLFNKDPEKERLKDNLEATREEAIEMQKPAGDYKSTIDKL